MPVELAPSWDCAPPWGAGGRPRGLGRAGPACSGVCLGSWLLQEEEEEAAPFEQCRRDAVLSVQLSGSCGICFVSPA